MPKFSYSAVSLTGEQVSGEQVAVAKADVIKTLRQNGYFPTNVSKVGGDTAKAKVKIPTKVLAGFCTNMAAMVRTGVPIAKTLEILKDQMDNKSLRKIMDDIHESVQKGMSLSEAFNEYHETFPPMLLNMIEAGEASGSLDNCLERAGQYFTRNAKLNSKVKNAMIYPSIIMVVLVVMLIVLLVFVIPTITELYADHDAELPAFTQLLLRVSDFMVESWFIVVGVAAFLITLFNAWISSDLGKSFFDRMKLRLPVISKLIMKIYSARFARTLSSLGAAGVPLTQALTVTSRSIMNRHIEKVIQKDVVDAITRGAEFSAQLEKLNIFPSMITYLVKLGEESGTLDSLLEQAADFYDEEADNAVTAMTAMMEPMLIIIMAAIVVPVLIGALAPVFGMVDVMM